MAHAKPALKKKELHPAALTAPKKDILTRKELMSLILANHPASARSKGDRV